MIFFFVQQNFSHVLNVLIDQRELSFYFYITESRDVDLI